MSEIFTAAHNPEIFLYQMANRRATVFVRLTHLAAQIYGVTEEVIIRREDQFQVNAGPFFTLVERAFEHPTDLLYVWASYAAGIYETLKGERYTWLWGDGMIDEERQDRVIQIDARLHSHAINPKLTNKIIGPHWYKAE